MFYIGSEIDANEEQIDSNEEQLVISKQELRHLHDENLSMALVIRNGFAHQLLYPVKAPIEQVVKLNNHILDMYFASHGRAPAKRRGLGQRLTRAELYECLIWENRVANTSSPDLKMWVAPNYITVPVLAFPYDQDTRFLFIVAPDGKLITMKFQNILVEPDDIKKKYVQLLHAPHDQVVAADRVRLFPTTSSRRTTRRS